MNGFELTVALIIAAVTGAYLRDMWVKHYQYRRSIIERRRDEELRLYWTARDHGDE